MKKTNNIFIAGHNGMVGSSIARILKKNKKNKLILADRNKLDLSIQQDVANFFANQDIDEVYLTAGKVGGIMANNTYPAEFIYQNLMIVTNIINCAFHNKVKKLLFLGSSCVYPKYASQPIDEKSLLTGLLEPTNEPYAIAKIAGIKMCESYNRQYGSSHGIDYRSVMPTNLYGPNDNYHPQNSHVLPALISKFHKAKMTNKKKIRIWGTGRPRREFLFVDDLSAASILIMNLDKKSYLKKVQPMCSHINVGAGYDISIKELADLIAKIVGYKGKIYFDNSKPDGTPQKLINSSLVMKLGWKPKMTLSKGLKITYKDFCNSL